MLYVKGVSIKNFGPYFEGTDWRAWGKIVSTILRFGHLVENFSVVALAKIFWWCSYVICYLRGSLVRSTVLGGTSRQAVKCVLKQETSYTPSSSVKKIVKVGLFSKIKSGDWKWKKNNRGKLHLEHPTVPLKFNLIEHPCPCAKIL